MNLTYFRAKIKRVCGKQNNNPVNIKFVAKTSEHQKFIGEHHI